MKFGPPTAPPSAAFLSGGFNEYPAAIAIGVYLAGAIAAEEYEYE
jgi:hypothetical protein